MGRKKVEIAKDAPSSLGEVRDAETDKFGKAGKGWVLIPEYNGDNVPHKRPGKR